MNEAPFKGFTKPTYTFLTELAENNDRDWFAANKSRYQAHVVEPMSAFIRDIAPRLHAISPHFNADPKPNGGSMFRIYRDIRFSKDKRPYKEHIACQFRHVVGTSAHTPSFYVHIEPQKTLVGGGIWMPGGPVLRDIRTAIADAAGGWQSIVADSDFVNTFGELHGEQLKRAPSGFAADHPCVDDLRRKSFYAMSEIKSTMTRKPDFIDTVDRVFQQAAPLVKFLVEAQGSDW